MFAFYQLQQYTANRVINHIPQIEKNTGVKMSIDGEKIKLTGQQDKVIQAIELLELQHNQYWFVSWCFHNRKFKKARNIQSFHCMDVENIPISIIKQVIGKKGCYFINITEKYGLNAIWHNRAYNTIEFWGDYIARYQAQQYIQNLIFKKYH